MKVYLVISWNRPREEHSYDLEKMFLDEGKARTCAEEMNGIRTTPLAIEHRHGTYYDVEEWEVIE